VLARPQRPAAAPPPQAAATSGYAISATMTIA
jgi:hypothetical protein